MVNNPNLLRFPIAYICPKCKTKLDGEYRPFCGECGQRMPREEKLQVFGLTIYPHRYGRSIIGIDAITARINQIGPTKCWLEEYHPTFRTAKIRICRRDESEWDHELICTSTIRIEMPIEDGWFGKITVQALPDGAVRVSDDEHSVLVIARGVSIQTVA